MRFEKIIVVGANKVACDCLNIICKNVDCDKVHVLETADDSISMLSKICKKNGVKYQQCTAKDMITKYLDTETDRISTLIVSANNRYIFKHSLISKSYVEIVNFHYALLPNYRGVNIPSWVIYNGEKETGVTWHYVTEEIDHGRILNQKKIAINDSTTAFDITKEGMNMSGIGFSEFFTDIINNKIEGTAVEYPENGKLFLSKDLPNKGCIHIYDPIDVIDRTLRAFDYNRMNILPKLMLKDHEDCFTIESYNIERTCARERGAAKSMEIKLLDNTYILSDESMCITIIVTKNI